MVQALQACSQCRRVEVHEKTTRMTAELQVCDDLRKMHRMEHVDRLDLHNHTVRDQQINLHCPTHRSAFVFDRNSQLSYDLKVVVEKVDKQSVTVDRFGESGSKRPMNLDRTTADWLLEGIELFFSWIHARCL